MNKPKMNLDAEGKEYFLKLVKQHPSLYDASDEYFGDEQMVKLALGQIALCTCLESEYSNTSLRLNGISTSFRVLIDFNLMFINQRTRPSNYGRNCKIISKKRKHYVVLNSLWE